jgi:hypothetical protein
MKKLFFIIAAIIAFMPLTPPTSAHRSGCHRWHSCPSDSGSYVCGDLGYSSGCPTSTPRIEANTWTTLATPKAPKYAKKGIAYIQSNDLARLGFVIAKERSGWYQLGINKNSIRVKPNTSTGYIGKKWKRTKLAGAPVIWQGALYVPVSVLRNVGCSIDTGLLPSGVTPSCGGSSIPDLVFVTIW